MKKWTKQEDKKLKELATSQTITEIATELKLSYHQVRTRLLRLGISPYKPQVSIETTQQKQESQSYKRKYEDAVSRITQLEKDLENSIGIKKLNFETYKIKPSLIKGQSESTAVVLLSDWHIDEIVKPQSVNFLNKFDDAIADARIKSTFQTIVKFCKLHQKETHIDTLVMALLGDFISGGIHDELKEGNVILPIEAIWRVQNHIASGIKHILENTEFNLVIPCSVGNHSRITEKQRVSTEQGQSLEWLMYKNLEQYFIGNKRVRFVINEGYHTYLNVYDYTLRFHHGHAIRYGGGVGGIYIPVKKAIAQWNKGKHADLDCFGHYHQLKNDGQFISNGSLIGWNAFANRIKADFETPRQAFFLINKEKKRFVTVVRPIILNGERSM